MFYKKITNYILQVSNNSQRLKNQNSLIIKFICFLKFVTYNLIIIRNYYYQLT